MRTEGLLSHGVSQVEKWVLVLGEAKMIFSFASQEKNVHPLPGLLGCFCPTRQGFYFDIIVPPGRVFITIYLQGNRLGVRCLRDHFIRPFP